MISRRRSRIIAVQALYAWDNSGQVATPDLLRFSWYEKHKDNAESDLTTDDLYFARHLVLGTIERIVDIDELIKVQTAHWDFDRINKVDLAILRVGVFSLQFTKEIAPSITIDEAISIAREYSTIDSYRFVNGVLDGIRKKIGV